MKQQCAKTLLFCAAIPFIFGMFNAANAEYIEPASYNTVIDGNNGGKRTETNETIDSYAFININSPDAWFGGGALDIREGISLGSTKLKNSLFFNNYAPTGGALTMGSPIVVDNVKFLSNKADTLGGAINYNSTGSDLLMYQINDSVFENNYAGTRGGALHIGGNPYLVLLNNVDFINNQAGQDGGAIFVNINPVMSYGMQFDGSVRILSSDGKEHVFSGNMQRIDDEWMSPQSNAITIQKGTVELKTQGNKNSKLTFDDTIYGSWDISQAKLKIDAQGGVITLNNQVKDLTMTHNNGILALNKSDKLANNTPVLNNVNLTLNPSADGTKLDLQNGKIDTLNLDKITIGSFSGNKTLTIAIDVDLKNGVSDTFYVNGIPDTINGMPSSLGKGTIAFNTDNFDISVIENGDAAGFQLFDGYLPGFLTEGTIEKFLDDEKIVFSAEQDNYGYINVSKEASSGLPDAVSSTQSVKTFEQLQDKDIKINSSLGELGGKSLTAVFKNTDIDGKSNAGITVSKGQTLEMKNIGTVDGEKSMHDFHTQGNGGVINNMGGTVILTDSVILNNKAEGLGGAVYSENGTVEINANTKDVIFKNNQSKQITARAGEYISNDIHLANSNLTVSGAKNVSFESGISGDGTIEKNNAGNMILAGDNSKFTGDVIYNKGNTTLQSGKYFNAKSTTFANNTSLNLANSNPTDNINFGDLTLNGTAKLGIDIDLQKGANDKIAANTVTGDGKIVIDNINITPITDPVSKGGEFAVITLDDAGTSPLLGRVEAAMPSYTSLGPIYKYETNYNSQNGIITSRAIGGKTSDGYNPAVLTGPVAALLGGYLTQLNSYDMAFNNMDTYMLMSNEQRQSLKYANKYASNIGGTYSSLNLFKDKGVWFKPYSIFENVKLQRGPKVSNIAYGSFFGYDSDIKELGHGFDAIGSIYAGYNGSHQTFKGNGIYQNGGTLGATGMLYKGNFFAGLTANAGANGASADTMYGSEDFAMLMAGVALKTGYNIETFKGRFIIQPNYLMSYTFVNTFDYKNGYGLDINSKPINAIQIAPGLKLIGNSKHGWQPYFSCSMVWNEIDKARFSANDVSLPELSIKPYFNYGLGLQKNGERFSGFFQAIVRSGGREGVGLQGGFWMAI